MKTRRQFITSLLGLATLPFAARALGKAAPPTITNASDAYLNWRASGMAGIKVPSNRYTVTHKVLDYAGRETITVRHAYYGDWDGTFKVEQGCSNPAYILASLLQPECDDYNRARVAVSSIATNAKTLDWNAIYHWGQFCDEMVLDIETCDLNLSKDGWYSTASSATWAPRFEVNTIVKTAAEGAKLREELRMHFLSWREEDPRYRRSIPVPYRGVKRSVFSTIA